MTVAQRIIAEISHHKRHNGDWGGWPEGVVMDRVTYLDLVAEATGTSLIYANPQGGDGNNYIFGLKIIVAAVDDEIFVA